MLIKTTLFDQDRATLAKLPDGFTSDEARQALDSKLTGRQWHRWLSELGYVSRSESYQQSRRWYPRASLSEADAIRIGAQPVRTNALGNAL